ncbi:MAG TPA: hypothetical protein VFL29_11565 [Candidatus Dormibacteraeota bacterium]|nr:hypothetical protein [Candidatus Dormibacteraeota bacterium]
MAPKQPRLPGVQFFTGTGLVEKPGRPDQFEAAAGKLALFRIESDQVRTP